ncbi:MAG: fumarylacetoacetate hydrolase, partial [Cohaesibacter sp.]|nr:fumarylacetoacetate hydrolase [Cohaesibacter sp.]
MVDITSSEAPTVRDVLEREDAADYVRDAYGQVLCPVDALSSDISWLAPCDFQAIKACGVTFAGSMVERVIEEQAAGEPEKADDIRQRVGARIGDSLSNIIP